MGKRRVTEETGSLKETRAYELGHSFPLGYLRRRLAPSALSRMDSVWVSLIKCPASTKLPWEAVARFVGNIYWWEQSLLGLLDLVSNVGCEYVNSPNPRSVEHGT